MKALSALLLAVSLWCLPTAASAQACRQNIGGTYNVEYSGVSYVGTPAAFSAIGMMTIYPNGTFDWEGVENRRDNHRVWSKRFGSPWTWDTTAYSDFYIPNVGDGCEIVFGGYWDLPEFFGLVSDNGRFISLSIYQAGGTAIRR